MTEIAIEALLYREQAGEEARAGSDAVTFPDYDTEPVVTFSAS